MNGKRNAMLGTMAAAMAAVAAVAMAADTVKLKDGTTVEGFIVVADANRVIIQNPAMLVPNAPRRLIAPDDVAEMTRLPARQWLELFQENRRQLQAQLRTCQSQSKPYADAVTQAKHELARFIRERAKIHGSSSTEMDLQVQLKAAEAKVAGNQTQVAQLRQQLNCLDELLGAINDRIKQEGGGRQKRPGKKGKEP
jgi:hypothetical protein